MFYREAGQFKTTYAADMAIFPIRQDRIGLALILARRLRRHSRHRRSVPARHDDDPVPRPLAGRDRPQHPDRLHRAAVARLGRLHGGRRLRLLQARRPISRTSTSSIWILASGLVSSAVGVVFGLPSLRIKGFYLVVATLAAQFFLEWAFARVPWLYNYNDSGAIEVATAHPVRRARHRAERDAGRRAISSR